MSLGFENLKEEDEEEEEEEEDLFCQKQKQNTNTIKHRGVFPEGHMAIVLDTSSKKKIIHQILFLKRKRTVHNTLQEHVNENTFMYQIPKYKTSKVKN